MPMLPDRLRLNYRGSNSYRLCISTISMYVFRSIASTSAFPATTLKPTGKNRKPEQPRRLYRTAFTFSRFTIHD